jgi:hypothetical protein
MATSFLRFLNHTQWHTTVGRTPLDEWSPRRRDLNLTTHNTHNRQISLPSVGFDPTVSASNRPQTHALDRAATGTGLYADIMLYYMYILYIYMMYKRKKCFVMATKSPLYIMCSVPPHKTSGIRFTERASLRVTVVCFVDVLCSTRCPDCGRRCQTHATIRRGVTTLAEAFIQ